MLDIIDLVKLNSTDFTASYMKEPENDLKLEIPNFLRRTSESVLIQAQLATICD